MAQKWQNNGTVLLMTRNWKYAILLSCKSAERRGTASEKRRLVSLFIPDVVFSDPPISDEKNIFRAESARMMSDSRETQVFLTNESSEL